MPMSVILRHAREPSPACTTQMSNLSGSHQLRLRDALKVTLAIIIMTAAPGGIASARDQSSGSSYTSTAEKDWRVASSARDASVTVCPGNAGLIGIVTEDDLPQPVSVGRNRKAAEN